MNSAEVKIEEPEEPKNAAQHRDPEILTVIYHWRNWEFIVVWLFGLAFTAVGGVAVAGTSALVCSSSLRLACCSWELGGWVIPLPFEHSILSLVGWTTDPFRAMVSDNMASLSQCDFGSARIALGGGA